MADGFNTGGSFPPPKAPAPDAKRVDAVGGFGAEVGTNDGPNGGKCVQGG